MEINEHLLEQLIDCRESNLPSARVVQLMASEIMRMRSYGDMIPAPEAELKQRSIRILKAIKQDKVVDETLDRLGKLLKPKLSLDCYATIKDLLMFVTAGTPLSDDADWIEIESALLLDAERVIHDAIGFGGSHSHKVHNDALITLRKYLENSQGSFMTLVPKDFLINIHQAIEEIVYGKVYSMATRDELKATIGKLIFSPDLTDSDDQDHA